MTKRWRLPSASATGSTVGRWMMSMVSLLAVQLDDERLAHGDVDVLAQRRVEDVGLPALAAALEPRRRLPVERVEVVADDDHVARLGPDRDHVALAHLVARDGDPLAVHLDVAVAHELPGLGPARPPTGAVGDVVEPQLEHAQEVLPGDAVLAVGLLVEVAELLLQDAVDAAGLLLLPQLEHVLRLTHPAPAVLARRVGPALDRA